jgi:chromate transporter
VIIAGGAAGAVVAGRSAIRTPLAGAIAALAAAAAGFLGVHELAILLVAGAAGRLTAWRRARRRRRGRGPAARRWRWRAGAAPGLLALFLTFAKIGSVLFGSGYVLLAFLRADLVERTHWLTEQQLLDAVAAGQITPGRCSRPRRSSATSSPGGRAPRRPPPGSSPPPSCSWPSAGRSSPGCAGPRPPSAFLDGVNAASLALHGGGDLAARPGGPDQRADVALALVSAVLLARWKVNTVWLVLGGAVVGWFSLKAPTLPTRWPDRRLRQGAKGTEPGQAWVAATVTDLGRVRCPEWRGQALRRAVP